MTSPNPHIPNLPQEIRATVLNQYDTDDSDLLHLWTTTRFVCLESKQVIEDLFAKRHLYSVSIYFACGTLFRRSRTSNYSRAFVYQDEGFATLRLTPDRRKAVFSSEKPKEKSVLQDLAITSEKDNPLVPRHIIRVGEQINDTPLPGLAVDLEHGTLEVTWRQLFEMFFAEEKLYSKLLAKNSSQPKPPTSKSACPPDHVTPRAQMQEIPLNARSFINPTLSLPLSLIGQSKRAARRLRLQHWYRAVLGHELIMDEKYLRQESQALRRLAECEDRIAKGGWKWEGGEEDGQAGGERFLIPMDLLPTVWSEVGGQRSWYRSAHEED